MMARHYLRMKKMSDSVVICDNLSHILVSDDNIKRRCAGRFFSWRSIETIENRWVDRSVCCHVRVGTRSDEFTGMRSLRGTYTSLRGAVALCST